MCLVCSLGWPDFFEASAPRLRIHVQHIPYVEVDALLGFGVDYFDELVDEESKVLGANV